LRRRRMKKIVLSTAAVLLLLSFCLGAAADTMYGPGFVWDAREDWVELPQSYQGTTNGNPGNDQNGNPVWSYEYFLGDISNSGLGSANPWYTRSTTKMVWQKSWYGETGKWVRSYNSLPNCAAANYWTCTSTGSAVMRWSNPCATPIQVYVRLQTGNAEEPYMGFQSGSGRADFAICLDRGTNGDVEALYTRTVTCKQPYIWPGITYLGDVDAGVVTVAPGESIFLTMINRSGDPYASMSAHLVIEVVPEPSSLLALAGGLATTLGLRRRKV
jgi:hypothetical protein